MKTDSKVWQSSEKFSKYKACCKCANRNKDYGFCGIYPVGSVERTECLNNNYKYFIPERK